jgi:hypothetical protein
VAFRFDQAGPSYVRVDVGRLRFLRDQQIVGGESGSHLDKLQSFSAWGDENNSKRKIGQLQIKEDRVERFGNGKASPPTVAEPLSFILSADVSGPLNTLLPLMTFLALLFLA